MKNKDYINNIDIPTPPRLVKKMFLDYAPTFKGKCYFCRKRIPKKSPRFWFWAKLNIKASKEPINVKRKVCYRCSNEMLDSLIRTHKEETKRLKIMKKKFNRCLKGKKCKRSIETNLALEEIESEKFPQNILNNQ
jgi:hypothetical protein